MPPIILPEDITMSQNCIRIPRRTPDAITKCNYCILTFIILSGAIIGPTLVAGFWKTDATHTHFSTFVCAETVESSDVTCNMNANTGKPWLPVRFVYPDRSFEVCAYPCVSSITRYSSICDATRGYGIRMLNSYSSFTPLACSNDPDIIVHTGWFFVSIPAFALLYYIGILIKQYCCCRKSNVVIALPSAPQPETAPQSIVISERYVNEFECGDITKG